MTDPAYALANTWDPADLDDAERMTWRCVETVNQLEVAYLLNDRDLLDAAVVVLLNALAYLVARAYDVTRDFAAYLAGVEDAAYAY